MLLDEAYLAEKERFEKHWTMRAAEVEKLSKVRKRLTCAIGLIFFHDFGWVLGIWSFCLRDLLVAIHADVALFN